MLLLTTVKAKAATDEKENAPASGFVYYYYIPKYFQVIIASIKLEPPAPPALNALTMFRRLRNQGIQLAEGVVCVFYVLLHILKDYVFFVLYSHSL